MKIDFELNELIPAIEEVLHIRQTHAEAVKNADSGGVLAAEWKEEAARLADLLAFLEEPQPSAVSPKLAEWAVRLSVRSGLQSDLDAHLSAEAIENDAENAFCLLAESKQSGDIASALASAAIYVCELWRRQGGEHG